MVDNEQLRKDALWHISQVLIRKSAKTVQYVTSLLGVIALIPNINLPPELRIIAASLGVNLISNLIDRVANDPEISDEEIKLLAEDAVRRSELERLLGKDDFYHAFSLLRESQRSSHEEHGAIIQLLKRLEPAEIDSIDVLDGLLDDPDNWVKVQGDEYIRHRYNSQFVIKSGKVINENYDEPWTRKFPDTHAWSFYVEYWEGPTLLKTSSFVVTDGGRYTIPVPTVRSQNKGSKGWDSFVFVVDTKSLEWKTAMLFEQYDSLLVILPAVGIILES